MSHASSSEESISETRPSSDQEMENANDSIPSANKERMCYFNGLVFEPSKEGEDEEEEAMCVEEGEDDGEQMDGMNKMRARGLWVLAFPNSFCHQ